MHNCSWHSHGFSIAFFLSIHVEKGNQPECSGSILASAVGPSPARFQATCSIRSETGLQGAHLLVVLRPSPLFDPECHLDPCPRLRNRPLSLWRLVWRRRTERFGSFGMKRWRWHLRFRFSGPKKSLPPSVSRLISQCVRVKVLLDRCVFPLFFFGSFLAPFSGT